MDGEGLNRSETILSQAGRAHKPYRAHGSHSQRSESSRARAKVLSDEISDVTGDVISDVRSEAPQCIATGCCASAVKREM